MMSRTMWMRFVKRLGVRTAPGGFPLRMSITPPMPSEGRSGLAIVATVKNEASYIADWMSWHSNAGVTHFYLYDDGSDDNTAELAKKIGGSSVTILPWRCRVNDTSTDRLINGQVLAFCHAIQNFGSDYRWMMFIDVDEFVFPKSAKTIPDVLKQLGDASCISLPWHMFGRCGHEVPPPGPIYANYTQRAAQPISDQKDITNFKCIVDPCEVTEVSVHHFSTRRHGETTFNDAGLPATRKGRRSSSFYSARNLQLNHYYSKSEQELRHKLSRGAASPEKKENYAARVRGAVAKIEADTVEDLQLVNLASSIKISET